MPPAGGGLLGMKHLTSAVNLAKLRDASRYGKQRELLEALLEGGLRREDVDTCGDDGFALAAASTFADVSVPTLAPSQATSPAPSA